MVKNNFYYGQIDLIIEDLKLLKKIKGKVFAERILIIAKEVEQVRLKLVKLKTAPDTPEVKEYEKRLEGIYRESVSMGEDGKPVQVNGKYQISNIEEYNKKVAVLNDEMKDTYEMLLGIEKRFEEELDRTFKLSIIESSHIPNTVSAEELEVIKNYAKR